MRILLSLVAAVSAALGAVFSRDGTADSALLTLSPLNKTSTLANYEVLFYEDPDFKGAGWGLVTSPNQPYLPDSRFQICYFVNPGRVSSIKLVRQANDQKFSCSFYRTVNACQHNIPALTLDYPAELASLGPDLDNKISAVLCWFTSPPPEEQLFKHDVAELQPYKRRQQDTKTSPFHLVDIFTEPDFSGDYTWYFYSSMLLSKCQNLVGSSTSPPWSSLRLNAIDFIHHCRFYEQLNCVEDGSALFFDIQQTGGGNSVRDLKATYDTKGKPWDDRLRSMKCVAGPWDRKMEETEEGTAYPLELYHDYNFTGTAQYYTWGQLANGLCVAFSPTSGISSARKNPGEKGYVCRGYATPDCSTKASGDWKGDGGFILLDTLSDLRLHGWDDRIWSVRCSVGGVESV